MDNFFDGQAKAIWDALDTMLKEDPEAYRKFISEQLEEGRQMIEKEKRDKKGSSSEATALGKLFGGMTIGKGQQAKKEEESSKKLSGNAGEGDGPGPLLDDEIGKKSILAEIVQSGECDDKAEENGEEVLSELKIPSVVPSASGVSSTGSSKKKMPLIEEL